MVNSTRFQHRQWSVVVVSYSGQWQWSVVVGNGVFQSFFNWRYQLLVGRNIFTVSLINGQLYMWSIFYVWSIIYVASFTCEQLQWLVLGIANFSSQFINGQIQFSIYMRPVLHVVNFLYEYIKQCVQKCCGQRIRAIVIV